MSILGILTLLKALCATPQIFAIVDSEYNADNESFVVRLRSAASILGGVISPNSTSSDGVLVFWMKLELNNLDP